MKKFYAFFFACCGCSGLVQAQTPAQNWMPDGSRDLYIGLGAIVRPSYEGSKKHKVRPLPVFQMQWSNGAFVAGMNAGWHLSESPNVDFGPLLGLEAGRDASGTGDFVDIPSYDYNSGATDGKTEGALGKSKNSSIRTRPMVGGFYNLQIHPQMRLNNQILYGAGNDRKGLRFHSDLRFKLQEIFSHQTITLGIGFEAVNQSYAESYFGVGSYNQKPINLIEGLSVSKFTTTNATNTRRYQPKAGIKDVHLDLFWNWTLSSSWMVTSKVHLSYLLNSAAQSPIVSQKKNLTFSTALAYRF